MRFDLTDEQRELVREVRERADGVLDGPLPYEPDEGTVLDAWREAAARRLTGLCLPTGYGGRGLGALDTALCLEAMGASAMDTGFVFAVAAHLLACGVAIRDFGSVDTRAQILPGLASGRLVAANAMTEPGAGSDVSSLETTAARDGASYLLNGTKSFVSNGPIADILVTYATTDPAGGYLGISAFVVHRRTPGVKVGPPLGKPGLRGCLAAQVTFDDCRVDADRMLGPAGGGSVVFQASMVWERACLPAIYLGTMERQLARCVAHARSRRQFGRPLTEFQAVSHRLAVMKQRLESSRLLVYRSCWLLDRGDGSAPAHAALSKLTVSESVVANGLDTVHLHGSAGYLDSGGLAAGLLDGLPSTIFSGTTEIQKEIIVNGLLS
jgi:clorobiocin biosynthesis protein CloN3